MLAVKNIFKSFHSTTALNGVDLALEEGEMLGLLGPNGAGKSTLINILSGLVRMDRGTVTFQGREISPNAAGYKMQLGVVPQEIALYQDISAWRNLLFWGSLYGLKGQQLRERAETVLRELGLYDRRHDLVKNYSGGMKRRVNIGAALLHDPGLLFFDEPTVGIDPQSRNLIYDFIQRIKSRGKTILYTTHYLEEAQNLCDRIAIIDQGRVVTSGTLEELRAASAIRETVEIQVDHPENLGAGLLDNLRKDAFTVSLAGDNLTVAGTDVSLALPGMLDALQKPDHPVRRIEIKRVNLENMFLEQTGRQLRD